VNVALDGRGQTPKAPSVRVSALGPTPMAGPEPGAPLPPDVLGDVLRVEVTQVNTGLSQYTIVLNNAFLTLPAERRTMNPGALAASGPVERLTPANTPFWPRFKYNDFVLLQFGQRLRIDMRFWPGDRAIAPGAPSSQQWVPMISGPITDMRFSFATGQGAELTLSGEDDLSILKDKQNKRVPMDRQGEVSIVQQVLQQAQLNLTFAEPAVEYPDFVTDDSQGIQEAVQSGQCWLDLVNKLAERLDFEVFAEFADSPPVPSPPGADQLSPPPALEFHFEPYRARAPFDPVRRSVYRLDRERNMLEFNPTIKVGDQYSEAEVRGRHRDPQQAREVLGNATHDILDDELQVDPALDGPLSTGPEVRSSFFPGRESKFVVPNQTNIDEVRGSAYAEAAIRKKARELFSIDVLAVGDPRIRPGRHVEIRGMRPPFDGFYYITKVVHSFGTDGLRTRITASRPGMELPNGGMYFEPSQQTQGVVP
jgi:hypothetical protein